MPNPPPVRPNSPPYKRKVTSWPTPVISDNILIEYLSTETGDYTPLPYGTRYNEVNHAPFQPGKDNFYLVFQGPVDNSGWVVQRVWANDRTDQDSYNFSITYLSENPDYPQIVRTYVYPRDRYGADKNPSVGPLPPLTPDPDYPDALLVQEQMAPDAGEQLNSRYVRVTRVYQTLPGPFTYSQDFDSELNFLVWTSRQLVLSDDVFQPEYNLLTLEMRETPQSAYVKLRIRSYLEELPPSFQGYQTGSFPFPNILTDLTWDKVTIAPTPNPFSTTSPPAALGRAEVIVVPSIRPGPSTPALFKTITSYYVSEPTPTTIYAINPNDISYRGISVQMAINSVLNNPINLSVSFSNDGKYGNANDDFSIGSSTPSASNYIAAIGTYQTVASDITRWRGSIWVKRDQQVLLL